MRKYCIICGKNTEHDISFNYMSCRKCGRDIQHRRFSPKYSDKIKVKRLNI